MKQRWQGVFLPAIISLRCYMYKLSGVFTYLSFHCWHWRKKWQNTAWLPHKGRPAGGGRPPSDIPTSWRALVYFRDVIEGISLQSETCRSIESIGIFTNPPTERTYKPDPRVEFPLTAHFTGAWAALQTAICLLLGAPWIVNVNMTHSKERTLERMPEGAQWLHCIDKASCCQGNGTEVIEFSQSSQESYVCIMPVW